MSAQIEGQYYGQAKPLFALYMKTAFLTIITLGIYRFWAKTRIRKYIWSATSGDGDSFEYTGTGLEKFLGFLVAIVILAVYLGIVQMILFYFGLNLFVDPETSSQSAQLAQLGAIYITFFAVLPLLLFAQYRARRYKMARTRWRGLRFGMESAAWGFTWRALGYYLLAFVSLGLLSPLATFKLEQYMADRSWYGDAKFVQEGRWQQLYPGMKHIFIGLGILLVGAILGAVLEAVVLALVASIVGYVWILIGTIYYNIWSFNYMMSRKVLDGRVRFVSEAVPSKVIMIYVIGFIITMVVGGAIFGIAAGVIAASVSGGAIPGLGTVIFSAVLYVVALLILGGLSIVMITQPMIEHVVTHVTVDNADHLATIRQRAADTGADAEGFADALDIGGAI